ncbi:MAG: EAL domain-containing protein [Proteobacteria bacterium]|nr:EAL domain-containing protein [Pseudomonadota bacterium]MBU1611209.1 EAL domain-containing protein [Pseudomonadota bacterium]
MPDTDKTCDTLFLQDILDTGSVQSFFQPVVSIQKKSIIGFEAFARGVSGKDQQMVKPGVLFDACHDLETQLKVDRICRKAALEQFQSIYRSHQNILLFLNINSNSLSAPGVQKEHLLEAARSYGYEPKHLVIEVEERMINESFPWELFQFYKEQGFKFSIDDIGAGGLGLDKMFMIKPDFIKVSRKIFEDMKEKPYKADMLKSLKKASEELGCILVGKSVEIESEAFDLLEADIFYQQGFFYTKTKGDDTTRKPLEIFQEKISKVYAKFRARATSSIKAKKEMFETYHKTTNKIMFKLEGSAENEFTELCRRICIGIKEVAGIFLLNEAGIQITPRLTKIPATDGKTSLKESGEGEDHSIKDYVLYLEMGFEKFVSPAFVSPLTKASHTIISRRFYNREGKGYIICVEYPYLAS